MRFALSMLSMVVSAMAVIQAEAPADYYLSCEGKKGESLLSELCDVVGPHTVVSYDGLWTIYPETDVDADGKVWDMYSTKRWTVNQQKCGNYSLVGDCYNREHSFPKSWFNEASPMKSDAFHVYPTDGKVNGQRSNYPYGECEGGTSLPANGSVKPLGRLGTSTFPGYTGTVFEPDDEYKGDFARTYFYMAAAYNDRIKNWNSPMLAGNAYPAFTEWSVALLLKWHRQDPVSEKELARNEAVYKYQHNRNPFIDYPDLAEHIWGNSVSQGWMPDEDDTPKLSKPVEGTTINFGTVSAGVTRYYSVDVKGVNFTEPLTVSISGSCFYSGVATIPASGANNGYSLPLSVLSPAEGIVRGTLTLSNSTFSRSWELTATIVNGLPAMAAENVTETSFVARWVNIDGPEDIYTIHVMRDGAYVAGFPDEEFAAEERYEVTGLEPSTTYTYYITNRDLVSNTVTVTTATPHPSIQLLYDGELELVANAGEASEAKEVLALIENVGGDVTVSVEAPFALSSDKMVWDTSLVLEPGDDSFYIRALSDEAGTFTSTIILSADDYVYDDESVTAIIKSTTGLMETFETNEFKENYSDGEWQGAGCLWKCTNVGVYAADKSLAHDGAQCARFGKNATSTLEMAEDLESGAGRVSFWAKAWGSDADATVHLEYSLDGGNSWREAGAFTIPKGSGYNEYAASVDHEGKVRLRLRQSSGSRLLVDDIEAPSYRAVTLESVSTSRGWDAYCRAGSLIMEAPEAATLTVYTFAGVSVATLTVEGTVTLDLPAGVYIVNSADGSKKVIVKK